jgi:hypothetical protein
MDPTGWGGVLFDGAAGAGATVAVALAAVALTYRLQRRLTREDRVRATIGRMFDAIERSDQGEEPLGALKNCVADLNVEALRLQMELRGYAPDVGLWTRDLLASDWDRVKSLPSAPPAGGLIRQLVQGDTKFTSCVAILAQWAIDGFPQWGRHEMDRRLRLRGLGPVARVHHV